MSLVLGKVVSLILEECFGPITQLIGNYLHLNGPSPLLYIKRDTNLPLSKVKETLCVMIKYDLVTFSPNKNPNIANYCLQHEKILLTLRYPKYITIIKTKFGDESEILFLQLIQNGCATMSDVLLKTRTRLLQEHEQETTFADLRDRFTSLIVARYIQRVPLDETDTPVLNTQQTEAQKFAQPEINIKFLAESITSDVKVKNFPDKNIFWRVNPDRFHQDMRDELIVNAMNKKMDPECGEVVRLLLQQMYIRTEPWAHNSNPVPIIEVKELIKKQNRFPNLTAYIDDYVSIIDKDSCDVITKVGEAGGGSFQINMKKMFLVLTWETIEHVVMEKFGSNAARIFRLIRTKGYIEPDDIQRLAMIPAKEAKRLSYQLLEENFVDILELKKPITAGGAAKSFTLFHVQIARVVRMVLELCYKTLYNMMTRKNSEKYVNKRIIEKKTRVEAILLSLKGQQATEDQIVDIEEMVTPPEKEILNKIEENLQKLNAVEFAVDDTLFILQLYLAYEIE